jgi:hypothetical protein
MLENKKMMDKWLHKYESRNRINVKDILNGGFWKFFFIFLFLENNLFYASFVIENYKNINYYKNLYFDTNFKHHLDDFMH